MKKIRLEDIEPYQSKDLDIDDLAKKIADDFDISVEEAKAQISELTEQKVGNDGA